MVELDHSPDQKKYLSVKEAAQLVGYTSDYVTRLLRDGKVIGVRSGRTWEVDIDSLKTFALEAEAQKARRQEELRRERLEEKKMQMLAVRKEAPLVVPSAKVALVRTSVVFAMVCLLVVEFASLASGHSMASVRAVAFGTESVRLATRTFETFYQQEETISSYAQQASIFGAFEGTLCEQFNSATLRWFGICERQVDIAYAIIPEPVGLPQAAPVTPGFVAPPVALRFKPVT